MDSLKEASSIILASWGLGLSVFVGVVVGLLLGLSVPSAAAYLALMLTGRLPLRSFRENFAEIMATMLGGMIGAWLIQMIGGGVVLFIGLLMGPVLLIFGALMLWAVIFIFWWRFLTEHLDFGLSTFLVYTFNLNILFPIIFVFFFLVPVAVCIGRDAPELKTASSAAVAAPAPERALGLAAAAADVADARGAGETAVESVAGPEIPRYDVAVLIQELNKPIRSMILPLDSRMILAGMVSKADYTGLFFSTRIGRRARIF